MEAPPGADPTVYVLQGQGTGLFSMVVPLAGHYVVRLTVTNTNTIPSLDTVQSRVEFNAIPQEGIHIQLVWDDPVNDQDMHLTNVVSDDRVCNEPNDCYFSNCTPSATPDPGAPHWFASDPVFEGANPRLDRDDTNGLGPENINIKVPKAGVYRIYVHYYDSRNAFGQAPTLNTIRIWINGVQQAEYSRMLQAQDWVWAVADITWLATATGTVTPYPQDQAGESGAIQFMTGGCLPPDGWLFQ